MDNLMQKFLGGIVLGLKFLSFLVVLAIISKASPAQAEVSLSPTHDTKYVCVSGETIVAATGSIVTSRAKCTELAESTPGSEVYLVNSSTIVFTAEPEKEWLVAPIWNSDTRALYECGPICEQITQRGAKLGRSDPELIGRCEGPLTPVWGGVTAQWQYHTNVDGIRGLVYCKLDVPAGPPLSTPTLPVEPPEALPDFVGLSAPGIPSIYPSADAMTAEDTTWRISYDLLENTGDIGLISRDLTGQPQAGHFDVRINAQGYIVARMQGLNTGLVELKSTVRAVGGPQVVEIIRSDSLVELHLNGFPQDSTSEIYPMAGNDLSLVVGASCQSCTEDAVGLKWEAPMAVMLELFPTSSPPPTDPVIEPPTEPPVDGIYTATGRWTAPTKNTDGTSITDDLFYTVYWGEQSGNYPNKVISGLNALSVSIPLPIGKTYFLVVTATDESGNQSRYSNEIEFTPPTE